MRNICEDCRYVYRPKSISDYYKKTYSYPDDMDSWGKDYKKQLFYLCSNPLLSVTDCRNGYRIMMPCININGECKFFRTENAEDILPSTVRLSEVPELTVGDEAELSVTVTPFSTPDVLMKNQKQASDGSPMFDENGVPVLEDSVTGSEIADEQKIEYRYEWHKNGRRLWNQKTPYLKLDTSKPADDYFTCIVVQTINDNGDGGNKECKTITNCVEVVVKEAHD